MTRPAALLAALTLVLGAAACGGDDSADPLSLEQRLPAEAEAHGSKPDPVETRRTAEGVDDFVTTIGEDEFVNPTESDLREFRQTGFVSAISDTRFFPGGAGEEHTPTAVHVRTLLMEFGSEDGAEEAIEIVHADSRRPCPQACAIRVEEFDPGDVPGAKGVRRYATAADLEAMGDDEQRSFDSYSVQFADGPVAYVVQLFGPPGQVSADRAEQIADELYDRVHGAPLPTG